MENTKDIGSTPMFLKDTDLDPAIVEVLQKFNIRMVEPLLVTQNNPSMIEGMSRALELTKQKLVTILNDLETQYPEHKVVPQNFQARGLGYIT